MNTLDNLTLKEWLYIWLETYKKPKIKTQCYRDYESCIKMYLNSILDMQLSDIKGLHIQKCINGIIANRRRVITYQILNNAFKYAMGNNLIQYNPLLAVDIVRSKKERRRFISYEEEEQLFSVCRSNNFKTLLVFYIETGVRRAEALSIRNEDIDYTNNCIYVSGTKTDNAKRIVPISERLKQILIDFYPMSKDMLFTFKKDYVSKKFRELCKRAGINKLCLHCLRHTFATRCMQKGIDTFIIKSWLGHADIQTTLNIYTHMSNDLQTQGLFTLNAQKL